MAAHIIEKGSIFNHSYIREDVLYLLQACHPIPDFTRLARHMSEESMQEAYCKYTSATTLDFSKILSFRNKPDHFKDVGPKFYVPHFARSLKAVNPSQVHENCSEEVTDRDNSFNSSSLVVGSFEHACSLYDNYKATSSRQGLQKISKRQGPFKKFLARHNTKATDVFSHRVLGVSSDYISPRSSNSRSFTAKDISQQSWNSFFKASQLTKTPNTAILNGSILEMGSAELNTPTVTESVEHSSLFHCKSVPVDVCVEPALSQLRELRGCATCVDCDPQQALVNKNTQGPLTPKSQFSSGLIVTKDILLSAMSKLKPVGKSLITNTGVLHPKQSSSDSDRENQVPTTAEGNCCNDKATLSRFFDVHAAICKEIKSGVKLRKIENNASRRHDRAFFGSSTCGTQMANMLEYGETGEFVKRIEAIRASVQYNSNTSCIDSD